MSYTLPSDTHLSGDAGHTGDHNNIVDVLTGMGAAANVLNTAYSGGADPTGASSSTAAIQAALNTGKHVYLPAGTYQAAGLFLTADGQQMFGDGPQQTIIKPAASTTADVILSSQLPGSAGLSGFIRNYIVVRDLAIDGTNMTGTVAGNGNGIHFYGTRYARIFNCYIHNIPNYAILLDGDNTGPGNNFGYNVHVRHCIFDAVAGGIKAVNCEACNITENEFKAASSATAANQPLFSSPSTYAGHVHMTNGYAYIAGNVFGNLGTYTTEAVRLENSGPCRIIGNRFDQVRYQAVHCTAGANIISGNQIGNPSSSGSVEGILLGSPGNIVEGNTFDLTNGAAHFTYCISEGGAYAGNVIRGNSFSTGTTGVLNLNAGSTPKVAGNTGYNPKGSITPPTVTASPFTWTNQTGVDCQVFVNGGTVSAVSIGGTATGVAATGRDFRVPSGQSITITYSSAPTLSVFGD